MAGYNSPFAGEVDTTAPFESVRAAVNLFGEIADPRALKFPSAEKRASLELQQLRENLSATKLQLAQAQTAKSSLFQELLETKRLVELKTSELSKVLTASPSSTAAREADETYSQIEAVSNAMKEKYEAAVATLASTQEEVERLNAEIESSVAALELQKREHEEVRELHHRATSPDASVERELLSAKNLEIENVKHEMGSVKQELTAVRESKLELLSAKTLEIESVKREFTAVRDSKTKLEEEVRTISANLQKVREEAEQARVSELKAESAVEAAAREVEELKKKLSSLDEEKAHLAALSDSLRDQLAKAKMEMAALKEEAESAVYASQSPSPAVTEELQKLRAELAVVLETEAKAKETITVVTESLQRVTFEADEARLTAEVALEEAHKAKQELEEARAAALTAESKLEAATREARAAKASENMALAELKALTEKASGSPSEKGKSSRKMEIESLTQRVKEAEEVAEMKVAAAVARADAAKASEREVLTKLEAVMEEVESNRALVKQALQRAENAEAAKNAIENELRRRRKASSQEQQHHHQHHQHHHHHQHQQQQQQSSGSGDAPAAAAAAGRRSSPFHGSGSLLSQTPDRRVSEPPPVSQTMHRRSLDYSSDHSFVSADVSAESIAQLFQLKVVPPLKAPAPIPEKPDAKQLKKGKSFIPKLGSYLSRRKSSVGSTSPR